MKKRMLCILLILITVFLAACGGNGASSSLKDSEEEKRENKQQEIINRLLEEISLEGIKITTGEIEEFRLEKRVKIVAEIPNYTELFITAIEEENFEKAVAKAVNEKKYSTVEYSGYATVETDYTTGSEVINSDKIVKGFMEKELVKAINAVLEKEDMQK